MAPETLLKVILVIITVGYILDTWLDYINLRHGKKDLPGEMKGIYDEYQYERSIRYHREITRFGLFTGSIGFIVTFVLLAVGGFGWFDGILRNITDNYYLLPIIYFGAIMLISDVLTLPFQLHRTFVIEEKYGFNRMTVKMFFTDKLKSYLVGGLIGIPLFLLFLYLINRIGMDFWWIFWIIATAFMLFMNAFYTTLIVPVFNKLTPLEDGELKTAIENYCARVSFPLTNIYVIDGSRRSSKSNAFFSGLGKRKKVVLYDTLIENHNTEELVSVLAHEIGHYKRKHIIKTFGISILQTGLMLFILSRVIFNEEFSYALGAETYGLHLNLLTFTLLYSPVSTILGILTNVISRRHEFEADNYAATTYMADAMKLALKKLSKDNLSNLYPHPAYVFVNYSHPPLLQRLKAIDQASAVP